MAETEQRIQVLIADDHTVVRRGLATLLAAPKYGIEVVGEAADGQLAVEQARELQPDVILMDLFMPVTSGIEATRLIRGENQQVRILILTSSGDEEHVAQALQAGASGYLLKDASPDELVYAINSVYYGQLALSQELAQKVMLATSEQSQEPVSDPLTERELDVLHCIARGLSNKQIAQELTVSPATVRTHVSNILRKLNLENRTQIALYARDHQQ
jgi:DNA-binding NarL/FixJ family response regulator